jgi:hypothetical protein
MAGCCARNSGCKSVASIMISAREAHSKRGFITEGWIMLNHGMRPVLLLGKGDFLDPLYIESPLCLQPLGSITLADSSTISSGTTWVRGLSRHASRLSTPASAAMADLFVEWAERLDPDGKGPTMINLPLSQGQLGELLGMSSVHVNRTLKHFNAIEVLEHKMGRYTVTDRNRLKDIAEHP